MLGEKPSGCSCGSVCCSKLGPGLLLSPRSYCGLSYQDTSCRWEFSGRNIGIVLLLLTALVTGVAAQDQGVPKPVRFDLSLFAGYRTSIGFPIEPHVTGMNPRIVIEPSPSYGGSFGFRPHEDDLVEFRWARQDSHLHAEGITPLPPRQRVIVDQFHGDFSHEYFIEGGKDWARPFVIGSVGASHVSGTTNVDFTRFSFGLGGGIRFYLNRHFGFKLQAEWLPVFVDPHAAVICGRGCIIHVGGTASSQGEFIVAPVLRF